MNRVHRCLLFAAAFLALTMRAHSQVPDGWYVFSSFSPSSGKVGVFVSHPRRAGLPKLIKGLYGDLAGTGASCVLYRKSDGALLAGERAPTGASLDLHVLHLRGLSVFIDKSFSLGTAGSCCGEIPQMALLGDDRVVVAVTDVSAGLLKRIKTTSYGWQGVGIVNTRSGLITPITITNSAKIVDVFNGLAVSPDGKSLYLGTYVSANRGDLWRVPIQGGAASLVASVPAGLSNLCFDNKGQLWVTTLDADQGLFRVDVNKPAVVKIPQTNGSLNALAFEFAGGKFAALSARRGKPARSVFWMDANGGHQLLSNPGFAVLSGVSINPNPEVVAEGTPGPSASYQFEMPNPGGLPLVGNSGFSLTLAAKGLARPGIALLAASRLAKPVDVLGARLVVDPSTLFLAAAMPYHPSRMKLGLPIPNDASLAGVSFVVQTLHVESASRFSSSPALLVSVL